MQTKFRRKVSNGGGFQIAVLCFKPTVFVLTVLVEYLEGGRVHAAYTRDLQRGA